MQFTEMRRGLIFDATGLRVQDEGDTRRSKQWCIEDLSLTEDEWRTSIRGYISEDSIVFFRGEDYAPVLNITEERIRLARAAHRFAYTGATEVAIYTGVIPGVSETIWPPLYRYLLPSKCWSSVTNED